MPWTSEQQYSGMDFNHLDEDLVDYCPCQGGLSSPSRPRTPHDSSHHGDFPRDTLSISIPPAGCLLNHSLNQKPCPPAFCVYILCLPSRYKTKLSWLLPDTSLSTCAPGHASFQLLQDQTSKRPPSAFGMVKRPLLLFLSIPINRPLCSYISHLRKNHFCYSPWIPYSNLATSPFFCSLSKKMLQKSFLHSPSPILHSLGCISIRLFPTTPPDMLLLRSQSDLHIPG